MMTTRTRAEKIIEQYDGNTFHNAGQAHAWLTNAITSHLDAAVRDSIGQWCLVEGPRHEKTGFEEGFFAAREMAAEKCEECQQQDLAILIRAMEMK